MLPYVGSSRKKCTFNCHDTYRWLHDTCIWCWLRSWFVASKRSLGLSSRWNKRVDLLLFFPIGKVTRIYCRKWCHFKNIQKLELHASTVWNNLQLASLYHLSSPNIRASLQRAQFSRTLKAEFLSAPRWAGPPNESEFWGWKRPGSPRYASEGIHLEVEISGELRLLIMWSYVISDSVDGGSAAARNKS